MSILENLGVKKEVFVPTEIKLIEDALANGHHEHLAAIITQLSPEKVEEIEKIQKQLRPRDFSFESKKQKEFEIWLSKNGVQRLTPEVEANWQKEIEQEKQEKLAQLTGGMKTASKTVAKAVDGTSTVSVSLSNSLESLKGIGLTSIEKLRKAGVNNVQEFQALTSAQKEQILGAMVAGRIEAFNSSEA